MSAPASEISHRRLLAAALLALLPGLLSAAPADTPAASRANTTATPQRFSLQVLAPTLEILAAPAMNAPVVAEARRGSEFIATQQDGDWYRVELADGSAGWIALAPGSYGDMNITLRPLPADSAAPSTPAENENVLRGPVNSYRPAPGLPVIDPSRVPPPQALLPRESLPVPDRWRIMQALDFRYPFYDPYHQNVLKGDLPLQQLGPDWFFSLGLVSDSLLELRRLPTPVAPVGNGQPGQLDVFAKPQQSTFAESLIVNLSLAKGDTTFKPPEYEFRFVPVFNYNHSRVEEERALRVDPRQGVARSDNFVGVQELFVDKHLRNVSVRYDFDSLRLGIQPLQLDFRGFLFQDNALALRLFGNRDNNRWQYNLGVARRLEKDTNSGLNDLGQRLRDDDVYFFNLYRQDFPVPGFTSQLALVHNVNREDGDAYYDRNGFQVRPAVIGDARPHTYRVSYLGYNGDGHFGRYNLSASSYLAVGHADYDPLAQRAQKIQAWFGAAELSRDFDWIRLRGNLLYASGDRNPFDGTASGFDAIVENPQFAGADTSFFIRQAIPLIGGGGVALSGRNGLLPSLRSSKDQGQSNFVNPGLSLLGVGADFDVLPTLRLLGNASLLRFNDTEVLGVLRNQQPPDKSIGTDLSAGLQYRPLYSQNIVITGSVAALLPGRGLRELYDVDGSVPLYSALLNVILAY